MPQQAPMPVAQLVQLMTLELDTKMWFSACSAVYAILGAYAYETFGRVQK